MGRGRMGPGGGSSRGRMGPSGGSSRGSMGSSGGSSRGRSSVGIGWSSGRHHSHTTVFVGGHRHVHHHGSGSPIVAVIVGVIFALIGSFTLLGGIVSIFSSPEYLPVSAKYVRYDEGMGGWNYRTYDYTIDGIDYTNRSMQSWEFADEQDIGKFFTIYYLESDPNMIYEEIPENDDSGNGVMIFGGLLFASVGILTVVVSVKSIKKRNSSEDVGDGEIKKESVDSSRVRCPYCGTKYNRNSNNCPQCGASRDE